MIQTDLLDQADAVLVADAEDLLQNLELVKGAGNGQ